MPRLPEFGDVHPNTVVDLRCSMGIADVLRHESDMAVQLVRPTDSQVMMARLGYLHVCLFASPKYLNAHGTPRSREELSRHRLVDQVGPQIPDGILAKHLGLKSIEGIVAMRTNLSSTHYAAVEKGLGIGALPTYAIALGAELVPLDVDVYRRVDIWLTYHPDVQSVPRMRAFIDWLRSLFDASQYPWFGERFVHPKEFYELLSKRPSLVLPQAAGVVGEPN
jgi:DNA-binding transcriptional LysR family regulator